MPKQDPVTRARANQRERQRVSEMNGMFDVLLGFLPPSHFKTRLSRAQILREATAYINRLRKYLEASDDEDQKDAQTVFPHIFNDERKSNKETYRRPIKSKKEEGVTTAFISRHDLPTIQSPIEIPILNTVPFLPQTNVYIAYF